MFLLMTGGLRKNKSYCTLQEKYYFEKTEDIIDDKNDENRFNKRSTS